MCGGCSGDRDDDDDTSIPHVSQGQKNSWRVQAPRVETTQSLLLDDQVPLEQSHCLLPTKRRLAQVVISSGMLCIWLSEVKKNSRVSQQGILELFPLSLATCQKEKYARTAAVVLVREATTSNMAAFREEQHISAPSALVSKAVRCAPE